MATKVTSPASKKQAYWQGQVDAILNELKEGLKGIKEDDLREIKENQKAYIGDNSTQHEAIRKSIEGLKVRAAKWGGAAAIIVSVGIYLAIMLITHIVK